MPVSSTHAKGSKSSVFRGPMSRATTRFPGAKSLLAGRVETRKVLCVPQGKVIV
jgi:hypothetical protein